MAKSGDSYLLFSKQGLGEIPVYWYAMSGENYRGETYLDETYLNELTTLKEIIEVRSVYVRKDVNQEVWTESRQALFLLSEADFSGTLIYGRNTAKKEDYTYNGQILISDEIKKELGSVQVSGNKWLRASYGVLSWNITNGVVAYTAPYETTEGLCYAACWVNPDK